MNHIIDASVYERLTVLKHKQNINKREEEARIFLTCEVTFGNVLSFPRLLLS